MSETTGGAKKRDWFSIFLTLACIALAVLVVMLAKENRDLKQQMADLAKGPPLPEYAIKLGDSLEPFTVMDDGGGEYTIEYGGEWERTLLLIFSSQCPACEQTLPIWSEMVSGEIAQIPGVQIAGIQLDRLQQGGAESPLMVDAYSFPIYSIDLAANEFLKKIPFIPATIVVDAEGVVLNAWYEIPGDEIREEIRLALGG